VNGSGRSTSSKRTAGEGTRPAAPGEFRRRVVEVISNLEPGEVVTYGEIAAEAGFPGAARAVGRVLALSDGLPWWRVVTTGGRLVPGHEREQARRLREEGITVRRGSVPSAEVRPDSP
jgi:methylated-DNA-protein-cysteine methyltransferase related protein